MIAYYLNTDKRTDRRAHMEFVLKLDGFTPVRKSAITVDDAKGFKNRYLRSNWITHTAAILDSRYEDGYTLICEDDIIFTKPFATWYQSFMLTQEIDWDVFYLYGGNSAVPTRLKTVTNTHAYIVNPKSSSKVVERLIERYWWINSTQPKDGKSCIDEFFSNTLQHEMNFFGIADAAIQDRTTFGSDTGWGCNNNDINED